jgi:hypothetical protein
MTTWLKSNPYLIPQLIRPESLDGLFGTPYRALVDDQLRGEYAAPRLFALLEGWMQGQTLGEMEHAFGTNLDQVGKCESAREFVLRVVPELAYLFSAPAQILRALQAERGDEVEIPVALATLGVCVKEGFDRVEKFALRHYRKGQLSRRGVHREFVLLERYLVAPPPNESLPSVIHRVEQAVGIAALV